MKQQHLTTSGHGVLDVEDGLSLPDGDVLKHATVGPRASYSRW